MGKKAVTPEIKQRIIGLYLGGFNNSEIARTLKSVSRSCASRTIQKFKESGSTADKKRSGCPRKTNQTNDNYIYRIGRFYIYNFLYNAVFYLCNVKISKLLKFYQEISVRKNFAIKTKFDFTYV